MASVYERITLALSSLGKRRERDNAAEDGGRADSTAPGSNSRAPKRFRPWVQSDLHRRLETFKPLTWFAKPDTVGPVPCALRGWINDANDSLCCEHCNAKLVYPPNVSYDQRQAAADLFSPNLTTKHKATCPWRQTQCEAKLLGYIPSSTNDELRQVFQMLQGKLLKVDVLPEIDAIAVQALRDAAAPYGSYDDLVMGIVAGNDGGGSGGGAFAPTQYKPSTAVHIVDVTDAHNGTEVLMTPSTFTSNPGGVGGGALTPSGGGGGSSAAATPTYILQPSKMTPQQKARLLALLGWDIDVLQPDSASGSAALPYTQSAGYSLQHLGVKPKSASKVAAAAGVAAGANQGRYPMSSVVLKCSHCNCRTGLWNFAGLRPVPTGRLTPSQQAAGAAALLSPHGAGRGGGGSGGSGCAAAAITTTTASSVDPLSVTIAGGQYGLHGAAAIAAARPFGVAASAATPFRFGSSKSTEPVFGIAALGAEAQKQGGGEGAAGFGSPLGGGGAAAEPLAAGGGGGFSFLGRKRKADEQSTSEPMAIDSRLPKTPVGGDGGLTEGKRLRLESYTGRASPLLAQTPVAAADTQPRELDPVGQHRSWCPWIYTGSHDQPHTSGWQHMLRALSAQQQQQAAEAPGIATMNAARAGSEATEAAGASPTAMGARQLKDSALAAIRSL